MRRLAYDKDFILLAQRRSTCLISYLQADRDYEYPLLSIYGLLDNLAQHPTPANFVRCLLHVSDRWIATIFAD